MANEDLRDTGLEGAGEVEAKLGEEGFLLIDSCGFCRILRRPVSRSAVNIGDLCAVTHQPMLSVECCAASLAPVRSRACLFVCYADCLHLRLSLDHQIEFGDLACSNAPSQAVISVLRIASVYRKSCSEVVIGSQTGTATVLRYQCTARSILGYLQGGRSVLSSARLLLLGDSRLSRVGLACRHSHVSPTL